MTIKQYTSFNYNGTSSASLGVASVSLDDPWVEEPFLAGTTVETLMTKGRTKPYFKNLTKQPLRLSLNIAFTSSWTTSTIRQVARLFNVDYYKPLYFDTETDRIFYCMLDGDSQISHFNTNQGYITIELLCNDICSYSAYKETYHRTLTSVVTMNDVITNYAPSPATWQQLIISGNTLNLLLTSMPLNFKLADIRTENITSVSFTNVGDLDIYPEIIVGKNLTSGNITVKNNTTNQTLGVTSLLPLENVYIDNEKEIVTSDIAGPYKYDNHNNVFLKMVPGVNTISVTGGVWNLQFRWQYKLLQL